MGNIGVAIIRNGVQPSPRDENYKVRDVKYDRQLGRLVTLTTNGAVQLWDPHLSPIRTVKTRVALLAVVWRFLFYWLNFLKSPGSCR